MRAFRFYPEREIVVMTERNPGGESARPELYAPRIWNTLAFRIALLVDLTVISVLGVFAFLDYQRERTVHLHQEAERLLEEAKVLSVARSRLHSDTEFQEFVNDFCHQMSSAASPGHHIVLLDTAGNVIMRAHERADSELETQMAAASGRLNQGVSTPATVSSFQHGESDYIAAYKGTSNGNTLALAQSTAAIRHIIRNQGISRITSLGILVVLIFGVTTIGLLIWVRRPLNRLVAGVSAIGRGDFATKVPQSGSSELRFLAGHINKMTRALDRVERGRQAEMERARAIQQGLLPSKERNIEGFDFGAVFLPAASVGGDLYDVVELADGSTLVAVLDVSGHGVAAALYTALLRTVLRHQAAATADLARIAQQMNSELCAVSDLGEFATCFFARVVDCSGMIEYVSAGHCPGLIAKCDGTVIQLRGDGMLLGVNAGANYDILNARMHSGDRLFLFTDGLHEVFDGEGRQFGRERLNGLLASGPNPSLADHLKAVVECVRSFQQRPRFDDDVTLLCVRRK